MWNDMIDMFIEFWNTNSINMTFDNDAWMSTYFHQHRGSQLSWHFFSVAQDMFS